MKQILLVIVLLAAGGNAAQAQNLPDPAKGFYTMNVAGAKITEESYTLESLPNGATRHASEVSAGGNKTVFVTTIKHNRPLEFSIESGGAKALTAIFAGDAVKLTITGQPEKTIKTGSAVILENGVWSQFVELLSLYDAKIGGEQKIVGFLPSKMLDLHLTLLKGETQSLEIKGQKIEVEKYHLSVAEGNLNAEVWASKNRVPLLIEIPAQQIQVVRQGFEELLPLLSTKPEKTALKAFSGEFTSEDVEFQNGAVKLAGTLTIPKNAQKTFPAVILISGSGGQDRDGSQLFNLYKQIAESLSRAGIAALRVDDRGNGKSTMPAGAETSYRDLIADSRAAFDFLEKRPEIDRAGIAYLGHSEGAETALTLASEDKRVAAIILLAGTSRPVNEIVLEQEMFQRASAETINVADKTKIMPIAQTLTRQFEAAKKTENAANPKLAWYREHLASNPLLLAQKVKCPVLIVQGERDALVLPSHAIALAQAVAHAGNANVGLRILPDLTHLFTPVGGSKEETQKPSLELLQTLQNWANTNLLEKPQKP